MKTVRIDIRAVNETELKVVWNDDSAWLPYFISRKAVDSCAREIRRILAELVELGLNGRLRSCGPILKRLADEGSTLEQALFTKTGGETDPERVRRRYQRWPEPFRVRFCVSDSVFVPWGLLYTGDAGLLPDECPNEGATAWETYKDFWCVNRPLSTVYERIPPDAAGEGPDGSNAELIRIVHPSAFARAIEPIDGSPESGFLSWLTERHGEPLSTSRALKMRWRDRALQTRLLYFYCHASASGVALSEHETLDASRLMLALASAPPRPPDQSGCLLLLNGCSTAVGAREGDFVQSASRDGLCGFVGTETDVPDVFALRFSTALLYRLFHERERLGDAMLALCRQHFPLSLVYGLYAHPDFVMHQTQVPHVSALRSTNFSFGRVGSARLGLSP